MKAKASVWREEEIRFRLPEAEAKRLMAEAKRLRKPVSAILRVLVDQFLSLSPQDREEMMR